MTFSQLLLCASSDLGLLEPVGDALIEKEQALTAPEKVVLTLWIYLAANPEWKPFPVERGELELSLREVGEERIADDLPAVLAAPNFERASQVARACARYVRIHASKFNFSGDLAIRAPDAGHSLPQERMAAIFRNTPRT